MRGSTGCWVPLHAVLPGTGHGQGTDVRLLHSGWEVLSPDLLHQLPRWPWHHIVDGGSLESIESRSSSNSVSTHVLKEHPITNMHLGQVTALNNAVQAVTGRSPDAGWIILLIWFGSLHLRQRNTPAYTCSDQSSFNWCIQHIWKVPSAEEASRVRDRKGCSWMTHTLHRSHNT